MKQVCRIGLDIAKYKFQVHGVDAQGRDLFNRQLNRKDVLTFFANLPVCLIGIEACGGAHYWGRELEKLDHTVKLIPTLAVKPFVINNKTDAADARAICEVVGRSFVKFVPIKSTDQQDLGAWHRIRERLVGSRTALVNQARGLLHEMGIVMPQGIKWARTQLPVIIEDLENLLSFSARDYLSELYSELVYLDEQIEKMEKRLHAAVKANSACTRLMKIPGIGPLTASAIVAHVGDAKQFKNGRQFSASLGLTPREYSSGGKQKLLGITKRGNRYIRKLLISGAHAVCRRWLNQEESLNYRKKWLHEVTTRRGKFKAIVAMANKTARIAWAVLARGEEYQADNGCSAVGSIS